MKLPKIAKIMNIIFIVIGIVIITFTLTNYSNNDDSNKITNLAIILQFALISVLYMNFFYTHLDRANIKAFVLNKVTGSKVINMRLCNLGKNVALFDNNDSLPIESFRINNGNKEADFSFIEIPPQESLIVKIVLKDKFKELSKFRLYYIDNFGSQFISIKRKELMK